MMRHKSNVLAGELTVFFALLLPVFLGLFFALVESARVSGARAQAACNMDMANYSLFSEYEKQLLTDYEIFAFDGGYGGDSFSSGQVNKRLEKYLGWNEKPSRSGLYALLFDPWNIRLRESRIEKYALLTDAGGCSFYQQAVSYMKETAVTQAAGKLIGYYNDAKRMENLQQEYEEASQNAGDTLEIMEAEESAVWEEAQQEGIKLERPKGIANPLKEIARVVRRGVWESVSKDLQVSDRSVGGFTLASHRLLKRGTLKISSQNGGLLDDLLFREYLLDHFSNFLEKGESQSGDGDGVLLYQTEYLIAGKRSDLKNMKEIALRLVLLREGANYLYCIQDARMSSEAEALALLLVGWTGLPALIETVKNAMLLGWAYGESLIDVRTLLQGGKIPLFKDAGSWYLSLSSLENLSDILQEGGKDRGSGLAYRDYLRLLLNMQLISTQEKRGIDMLELDLRYGSGFPNFRADHCIVAVKDWASWVINPVFFRVTGAFTGVGAAGWEVDTDAGFSYQ